MSIAKLPNVVIANGGTDSTIIQGISIDDAEGIWLINTAVAGVVTYKIMVSDDEKATSVSTWKDYVNEAGTAPTVPLSGKAAFIPNLNVSFKIVASAAVGSECTWVVRKSWKAY